MIFKIYVIFYGSLKSSKLFCLQSTLINDLCLSVYPSIHLSVYPSIYPSIHAKFRGRLIYDTVRKIKFIYLGSAISNPRQNFYNVLSHFEYFRVFSRNFKKVENFGRKFFSEVPKFLRFGKILPYRFGFFNVETKWFDGWSKVCRCF